MHTFGFLLLGAICLLSCDGQGEQKLTLRGRVMFPGGSNIPVESDARLTVELQDTSLADAPAQVIARGMGRAVRFPMAFAMKYSSKQVREGMDYSLHVTIRNQNGDLLYINDVRVSVIPTGLKRTKLIDVPVILVKKTKPVVKRQWPELVGKNGDEAVRIIKQETGFTNVVKVKEGSVMTMDYCFNRVRVLVDGQGMVSSVPSIS